MEIVFKDYKLEDKNIVNLKIEHKKITGLIGNNNDKLIELLRLNIEDINNIIINDIKLNSKNIEPFRKRIELVEDTITYNKYEPSVRNLMLNKIKDNSIVLEDYNKKIVDSLKIVGLSSTYLDRPIITLSNLEKKLVLLSISLLSNPSLLIIKEPFKDIDLINKKKLIRFYNRIVDRYKKTIILISNNSNMLYENTSNIIYSKNNQIIEVTNTNDFFNNIKNIKKYKLDLPDSVEFINLVKEKKRYKINRL